MSLIAGRYSRDREIGRGGSSSVWLGRDEVLSRPVALKRVGMLPGASAPDLERADREARLAARLNDPHVVAVFDLVTDGTEQWLVMEYVDGRNLSELVRDTGPMSPDQAAPLLAQAAAALAASHAAGIVHRDVKPSNILVTAAGEVKLTDFGIARTETDVSLTQTGLVTGSPAYLAPEVAQGRTATDASDVWSLGATLFHALAGHPPYDVGDNLLGALYRIVHEEPPRTERGGWLTPLLDGTMTRNPADRWTMAQVRDFLAAGPIGAPASRPPSRTGGRARAGGPAAAGAAATHPTPTAPGPPGARPLVLAPTPPDDGRARRPLLTWLLLAALLLAVLLGSTAYVLGSRDDGSGADDATRPAPSPTTPATPDSTAPPRVPTAQDMQRFVQRYLRTADDDPDRAFDLLTPAYQEESGDLSGYLGFWGDVEIEGVANVVADVATLTVDYQYSYRKGGGEVRTEGVTMQLQREGDGFLVSDAT